MTPACQERQMQLLKRLDTLPSADGPMTLKPSGLPLAQQWYLYQKIREFVRYDAQDVTCPKRVIAAEDRAAEAQYEMDEPYPSHESEYLIEDGDIFGKPSSSLLIASKNHIRHINDCVLVEVKCLFLAVNVANILVDFEAAMIGAFCDVRPNARASGCSCFGQFSLLVKNLHVLLQLIADAIKIIETDSLVLSDVPKI